MMIDCIVADDEELLREALVAQLREAWPALEILATADSGPDALEAIATHKPAYAFLDIRMPGMTGLEVAMALPEVSPATLPVFVTAYDQYAVNAFEAGAVDYLLKPVERERLDATAGALRLSVAAIPEPSTYAMLLAGLGIVGLVVRRRRA